MKRLLSYILFFPSFIVLGLFTFCSSDITNTSTNAMITEAEEETTTGGAEGFAVVTAVSTSGNEGNYTFRVTLSSPDTGCDQYADWWEVLDTDGMLLYRRILAHSHVNEQPFTRSGGAVPIQEDTEIYVRGHMNTTGYGTRVMKGSVANGFQAVNAAADFAADLAGQEPLPDNCAF